MYASLPPPALALQAAGIDQVCLDTPWDPVTRGIPAGIDQGIPAGIDQVWLDTRWDPDVCGPDEVASACVPS